MGIEGRLELGNLHHPDLVNEVFRRIPLRHLTRLKTVSKTWFNYITRHRNLTPPTTSSGMVVFLESTSSNTSSSSHHKSIFLKLQDQEHCRSHGGGCVCRGVALHRSFDNRFMLLLDSCKELLLYATRDHSSWTYHVSSPFRLIDQVSCRALPSAHLISRPACSSLCFDGFGYSHEFRVACFFWEEVDTIAGTMNYLTFSCESWVWTEKKASIINPNLLLDREFVRGQCFGPRVYSRRKLYLLWSICLLIYHEDKQLFELIRLPSTTMKDDSRSNTPNRNNAYLFQFLWESNGVVHFCDPVDEGYCVWTLEGGLGDRPWRFKRFLKLDVVLSSPKLGIFHWMDDVVEVRVGWARARPTFCVFNEDLHVLYLFVPPGSIFSYSFETRRSDHVWSFSNDHEYWICKIFPFLYDVDFN